MATLEIQAILMFILRMAPAFLFILFMMLIFFSFRVQLNDNTIQRFTIELGDSLSSSPLALHRSVFNPQELTKAESQNNTELYAQNCDFGYKIKIESVAGPTICKADSDCAGFCSSACGSPAGAAEACTCNIELIGDNFCQCKKQGGNWQDDYRWQYGFTPAKGSIISQKFSESPVGIDNGGSMLPAKLSITAYDSTLTRLTCVTARATELKSAQITSINNIYGAMFRRTDSQGTNTCIYDKSDKPVDCRYFPGVNFEPFGMPNLAKAKITAYPVTRTATCDEIKSNPSLIAGPTDTVVTVVLCAGSA